MSPADQFEDRLRSTLDQYAGQIHADPPPWIPPNETLAGARGRARRRTPPRIRLGTVVAGLAVICSIAIAVLAIGVLHHPQRPQPASANPTPRQVISGRQVARRRRLLGQEEHAHFQVASALIENFAFLAPSARLGTFGHGAEGFTVTQPPFSSLPTFILQLGADGLGYDPRAAREISTLSGLHVWIVPGNGICILRAPAGGGACSGSLALALQQGDFIKEPIANGTKMFVGVVPTNNLTIVARTATGGTRTVPVIDGVFITSSVGLSSGPGVFNVSGSAASRESQSDLTVRPCLLSDLRLSVASQADSFTGEHDDLIVLTNATETSCGMTGYPHVMLETDGRQLGFVYADGGGPYVTTNKPRRVILAHRQSAYFLIAKYRCDFGILDTAHRVRVSLPAITGSAVVQLSQPGVYQLDYCRANPADQRMIDPGNRVTVSPIEASLPGALAGPRP